MIKGLILIFLFRFNFRKYSHGRHRHGILKHVSAVDILTCAGKLIYDKKGFSFVQTIRKETLEYVRMDCLRENKDFFWIKKL